MTNREIAEHIVRTVQSRGTVYTSEAGAAGWVLQFLNDIEKHGAELEKTAADLLSKHLERNARIIELENEVEEQCLLNAKGQEREMSLLGRLARFERITDKLADALDMWKNVCHTDPYQHERDMQIWERVRIKALEEYKVMKGEK